MTADAHGNFSGKRLVVLGCGYVGTAVASHALERGFGVTALTRNPAKAVALAAQGVETVVADLAGDDWHGRIAGGADWVLNCVSSGGGGVDGYRRSYVAGMRSVLAWARQRGAPGTLIYTGSTSVYPQNGGVRVDETAPTAGGDERAAVLLEAEQLLRDACDACGRWFILRLAGIYGPGRHHLLGQILMAGVSGRADCHLNLIHRDDIVAAIWAAFSAPAETANQIFNVADDAAANKGEVVAWLAARLGRPMPPFAGSRAGDRRTLTPDRIISNDRIRRQLAWQPHYPSYREGYAEILRAL